MSKRVLLVASGCVLLQCGAILLLYTRLQQVEHRLSELSKSAAESVPGVTATSPAIDRAVERVEADLAALEYRLRLVEDARQRVDTSKDGVSVAQQPDAREASTTITDEVMTALAEIAGKREAAELRTLCQAMIRDYQLAPNDEQMLFEFLVRDRAMRNDLWHEGPAYPGGESGPRRLQLWRMEQLGAMYSEPVASFIRGRLENQVLRPYPRNY